MPSSRAHQTHPGSSGSSGSVWRRRSGSRCRTWGPRERAAQMPEASDTHGRWLLLVDSVADS